VLVAVALTALSPSLPANDPDVVIPLASTSGHPDAGEVTSTRLVHAQVRAVSHRTPPTPDPARPTAPPTLSGATSPDDGATTPDVPTDPRVPRAPPRHG
jgi:hypothetical protein